MYERFTNHARQVMRLANQQARGFGHDYVRPQHILLGIVEDVGGLACNLIHNLGFELQVIRLNVVNLMKPDRATIIIGDVPLTAPAREVLLFADEERAQRRMAYLGTEDLLCGLLRDRGHMAAHVLLELGITLGDLRQAARSSANIID